MTSRGKIENSELSLHEIAIRLCGLTPVEWDREVLYLLGKKSFLEEIMLTVFGAGYSITSLFYAKYENDSKRTSKSWAARMKVRYGIIMEQLIIDINEKTLPAMFVDSDRLLPVITSRDANHVFVNVDNFHRYISAEGVVVNHFYMRQPFWRKAEANEMPAADSPQVGKIPDGNTPSDPSGSDRGILELITCEKIDDTEIKFVFGKRMVPCTIKDMGYKKFSTRNTRWFTLLAVATAKKYYIIPPGERWGPEADKRRKQLETMEKRLLIFFKDSFGLDLPEKTSLFEEQEQESAGVKVPIFRVL